MSLLSYIIFIVEFGALLVGGFRYRSLPSSLQFLEWFIVFTFGETIIEWVLASYNIQNLWMSHINTLIEFVLIMLMYFFWMKRTRNRSILSICFIVFGICWIVSKFTFESLSSLDGWTAPLSKVLQIVFSALLLLDVVKESNIAWINDPRIWVAAGIIIYSAGSLFIFALFNTMLQISPDRLKFVWSLNWILIIVSNLPLYMGLSVQEVTFNIWWTVALGTIALLAITVGFVAAIMTSKQKELVTKKRQIEELTISERKYRNLFEHSPAGMLRVTTEQWNVVDANSALLRMFGVQTLDEVKEVLSTMSPLDREYLVSELSTEGTVEDFKTLLQPQGWIGFLDILFCFGTFP